MAQDDAANQWGCILVQPQGPSRSRSDNVSIGMVDPNKSPLENLIWKQCNPFQLHHISPSGSDANAFCISALSNNNIESVIFATGLYVSGNDIDRLRKFSTTDFAIQAGLAFPMSPPGSPTPIGQEIYQRIVPMPYHIPDPTNQSTKFLSFRESQVLEELEFRCFFSQMIGNPIRVLMLELILAGCGAVLSITFLEKLAKLAAKHQFYFLIDEILTGARTGQVLYTLTMPKVFVDRVACITLGKWCGHGMVLWNTKHSYILPQFEYSRGLSTNISYGPSLHLWERMVQVAGQSEARRHAFLKKIKCPVAEAWGKGVMIYCPYKWIGPGQALKNRYLPCLESMKWAPLSLQKIDSLTIQSANKYLDDSAIKWLNYSRIYFGTHAARSVITYLVTPGYAVQLNWNHYNKHEFLNTINHWLGALHRPLLSWGDAKRVLDQLEMAGHCHCKRRAKRRKIGLQFQPTFYV